MHKNHLIVAMDKSRNINSSVMCRNTGDNFFDVVRKARQAYKGCSLYYYFEVSQKFRKLID